MGKPSAACRLAPRRIRPRIPEYRADADLGTEEEFREAVSIVRQKADTFPLHQFPHRQHQIRPYRRFYSGKCRPTKDGSPFVEAAGNRDLNFAVMCIHSSEWRNRLQSAVQYATERIGADGVYLTSSQWHRPAFATIRLTATPGTIGMKDTVPFLSR